MPILQTEILRKLNSVPRAIQLVVELGLEHSLSSTSCVRHCTRWIRPIFSPLGSLKFSGRNRHVHKEKMKMRGFFNLIKPHTSSKLYFFAIVPL